MFVFNFIFFKLHIYRFTELSNLASFGSLLCRFLHVYCLEFCVSDVFLVFYLFHYFIFFGFFWNSNSDKITDGNGGKGQFGDNTHRGVS